MKHLYIHIYIHMLYTCIIIIIGLCKAYLSIHLLPMYLWFWWLFYSFIYHHFTFLFLFSLIGSHFNVRSIYTHIYMWDIYIFTFANIIKCNYANTSFKHKWIYMCVYVVPYWYIKNCLILISSCIVFHCVEMTFVSPIVLCTSSYTLLLQIMLQWRFLHKHLCTLVWIYL